LNEECVVRFSPTLARCLDRAIADIDGPKLSEEPSEIIITTRRRDVDLLDVAPMTYMAAGEQYRYLQLARGTVSTTASKQRTLHSVLLLPTRGSRGRALFYSGCDFRV
jgi:hypothetical protein